MSSASKKRFARLRQMSAIWIWGAVAVGLVALAWATSGYWLSGEPAGASAESEEEGAAHSDDSSIALSPQARRNIGLETGAVRLRDHARNVSVPGMVVERPGKMRFHISAPMTGIVTRTAVAPGETVKSGQRLFTLRLTHEDLVTAQTEFLQTLGQAEVVQREIDRLQDIAGGAVGASVVRERRYEREKLEALLSAQREALQLHGLSREQVRWIEDRRHLLREITITAPLLHEDSSIHDDAEERTTTRTALRQDAPTGSESETPEEHITIVGEFVVEELTVHPGEAVQAGQALAVLADYRQLYIEGMAFEHDTEPLVRAADQRREVTAISESEEKQEIGGLEIVYVSNHIDRDSRTLHFYVGLENELLRRHERPNGREFVTWRFKPGQRMQLRVPVEVWEDAIVLPVDALAQEGAETFVFLENGQRFERRPVHVLYRDQFDAVIASDGSLFPGDVVALSGAHQLQMALKNKASGGGGHAHHGHVH